MHYTVAVYNILHTRTRARARTHKCTIRVYLYPFAKYTIFLTLSGLGYFISSRSTPRALCHEPSANIFFTFLSPFLLFLRYEGIFSTPFSYGSASARRRKTREDCGGGDEREDGRGGGENVLYFSEHNRESLLNWQKLWELLYRAA